MARRVFLSFVEEDLGLVNLFRGQAKSKNNQLEFSDYSVKVPYNSTDADYIKQQIKDRINNVSVTLCLIGKKTYLSKWVDWEIETSALLKKGIVGVRLDKLGILEIPKSLMMRSAIILSWDTTRILDAIEKAAIKAGY